MKTPVGIKEELFKIYYTKTVSGSENSALEFIKSELSDCCDEIFSDDIGNVYAVKKCGIENAKKIALVCPFDEAGFVVTSADEKKAHLHAVGDQAFSRLCGKEAFVWKKEAGGILLYDGDKPSSSDLYLETGDRLCDETIAEGDFVWISDPPVFLGENTAALNGLRTKAHAAGLLDVAKCASDYPFDVIFVFAAAHLLGSRGEKCAAYTADADIVIGFDFVAEGASCERGKGPVICFADAGGRCSREITEKLAEAAKNIGVGYCLKADADKKRPSVIAPFIAHGAKTGLVCVSLSKLEEGVGLCDLRDLRGAAAVACAYLIFEEE